MTPRSGRASAIVWVTLVLSACAGSASGPASNTSGCADIVGVTITPESGGSLRFDVTVASDDLGWDKYADLWEIRTVDGSVVAFRELTHPHVDEQPFTRSLTGVTLPDTVTGVVVAARDSAAGFCGRTMTVEVGH